MGIYRHLYCAIAHGAIHPFLDDFIVSDLWKDCLQAQTRGSPSEAHLTGSCDLYIAHGVEFPTNLLRRGIYHIDGVKHHNVMRLQEENVTLEPMGINLGIGISRRGEEFWNVCIQLVLASKLNGVRR